MPDIVLLPLDLLDPHPHNPRRDVGDITELAESIRAQGVRQNLLVVPQPHGNGHVLLQDFGVGWRCVSCSVPVRYTIVIGHRRAAAAQAAGLVKVPAAVDNTLDEQTQRSLMLVENLQRADLTPVEEAEAYQGLLDLGVKVREIVKRVGRSWLLQAVEINEHRRQLDDHERRAGVLRLRAAGWPWTDVAAAFGVTPNTARRWIGQDTPAAATPTPARRPPTRRVPVHAIQDWRTTSGDLDDLLTSLTHLIEGTNQV